MASREHRGPLQGRTTQAGSLHIVRLVLPCPPGPLASLEGCSVSVAGTGESPRKPRRCLGGRTYIMCPTLVPGWAPAQVGTAEGLSVWQWPEARAAARGDRTGARVAGSASSSGPSGWRRKRRPLCSQRVFPDGAGREGRWGDGVGRQKAGAASQGSTGLGGFRPRPRTASCPRPSREAWQEGTDSLGRGWEERGASPFTSPALRAPASQNSGGHRQAHLSACLPSLLLLLLQGRPAPPHFKAQH